MIGELPLVFGTHPKYRGPSTQFEYATSFAMQDSWVAFVKYGAKGLKARGWPAYIPGKKTAELIGTKPYPMQLTSLESVADQCFLFT
jgi:carboxylesterase type B